MAARYWEQANFDIEVARSLLQPDKYYAAANFAHQAAEKALKAACWHLRAEEPPWSHDLRALLDLLGERLAQTPETVRAAIAHLVPLLSVARYPSTEWSEPIPGRLVTEERAQAAVAWAREVMGWVAELLQQRPGRPQHGRKS